MLIARLLLSIGLCSLVSASASALSYEGHLDGLQESPPVATPGTGIGSAVVDTVANTLAIDLSFAGLIGTTSDSHIHCCFTDPPSRNIGVAIGFTSTGFPLGVTSGSYSHVFDLLDPAIYTASFLTNFGGGTAAGARDALINGFNTTTAYFNIHSSFRPGGEIRGDIFLVPEPATFALLLLGLTAMGAMRRQT